MDDDVAITKCRDCGRYSYRYNYQECPICSQQKQIEHLAHEKQMELINH